MLSDDAFASLVAEDVKNRISESQKKYLRLPENRDRWMRALELLMANLNDQIHDLDQRENSEVERYKSLGDAGVRLLAEIQTDFEQRRRKITRFRFYVETRLDEVNRLSTVESATSEERGRATDFFRTAIIKHRDMITYADMDYSEIDEALWATLDGKWEFDDIDLDTLLED